MMYKCLIVLVLVGLLATGCMTIDTPHGSQKSYGWSSNQMAKHADPTQKIDPSQTAWKGYDGHAAALALGDIKDPAARADAKEAMIAVSENSNMNIWGYSKSGSNKVIGVMADGRPPTVLGSSGAFGAMYNPNKFPIIVQIRGLGSPYTFRPGETVKLIVPHGKYQIWVYNAETKNLLGTNDKLDTKWGRHRRGDKTYDFIVRLDGR